MRASLYRNPRTGKPPIRIGLLLDTIQLPRWCAEVLEHVTESGFTSIELVVLIGAASRNDETRSRQPLVRKVLDVLRNLGVRGYLLFDLYKRWDSRNADRSIDPTVIVDCSQRLAQVESMRVAPAADGIVDRFPDDAVERIRNRALDVLIHFGSRALGGEILSAAKYGVWSYHHGDKDCYRGAPAYFWEMVERNPLSGAALQVLTDDPDGGKVLCKGVFATADGFSHARNAVQPYWGASTFMIQKLHELQTKGWEHVERNIVEPVLYRGRKKNYSKPTNWEMSRWLAPLLVAKTLRRLVRRPMIRHWRIAVRVGAQPIPDSRSLPNMNGFRWIESPKGRSYADPFVVEAVGKHWVYFEDFSYDTQLGRISCAEVGADGLGAPLTVLERPYHLSYPCIFRDSGSWYMIPESASAGTVALYRCSRFPDTWEFERELLEGSVVDTTVWIENGVYWFFVTFLEPRGGACQLWLYSAESIGGTWTPHEANPISTDIRYARGGGAIFRHGGKLYRPSQDDSTEYGRSMTLNEIVVIDHESFREVPRLTVDPSLIEGLVGTHTYSRAGNVEFIDGKKRVPVNQVL